MSDADTPTLESGEGGGRRPELVGETVAGRYRVLGRIGDGGFGVVYEADQTAPVRRRVALKVIKAGMDSDAVVSRFLAERQALAVMDHPGIAKVYDGGRLEPEHGSLPYFAMELVRGEPLTSHCDKHRLGIDARLRLFTEVCDAVQHAHMKGVIHRDLKPGNILVEYHDGVARPKVIDFGIAKALTQRLTDNTVYTQRGQLIGTPEYMSPEQAEMSGQDVDTRADVYSLGVILYELLTGLRPFEGAQFRGRSYPEIQRTLREQEPPRPSTRLSTRIGRGDDREAAEAIARTRSVEPRALIGTLKRDLDWIVMKCLEKDRTRRYETVNALSMEVGRYLRHEPVLAGPPSTAYRMSKFVRRNRALVAGGSAVAAALVLGAVGTTFGMIRAIEESERANAEAVAALAAEADAEEARRATERALEQAEAERRIAEQSLAFVNDEFLGQLDPALGGRPTMTARELVDGAAGGIADRFADSPAAERKVRLTIGTAYARLGLRDAALEHLRAAERLSVDLHGRESLERAEVLRMMAWSWYWAKPDQDVDEHLPQAIAWMREARDISASIDGPASPAALRDLGDLAMFEAFARGEAAAGLDPLALQMISGLRGQGESPEEIRAVLQENLVLLERLWASGRHQAASDVIDDLVEPVRTNPLLRRRLPLGLGGFMALLRQEDQFPNAVEAIGVYAVSWGDEHLGVDDGGSLTARLNLASHYANQGRFDEALELAEPVRSIVPEKYGPAHLYSVTLTFSVVEWLTGAGRHAEARRAFLDAEATFDSAWASVPDASRAMVADRIVSGLATLAEVDPEPGDEERLGVWRERLAAHRAEGATSGSPDASGP